MSKQINFFATESDKKIIADILESIFDVVVAVPYNKSEILDFNINGNNKVFLCEKSRVKDVVYKTHQYYDDTTSEILDYRISPILEYSPSNENQNENIVDGRFYCCSEDKEFSKKVSKFFTKLKKEFWYVKKWKVYVSKNIDIESSLFFIPNRTIKITKEDLS